MASGDTLVVLGRHEPRADHDLSAERSAGSDQGEALRRTLVFSPPVLAFIAALLTLGVAPALPVAASTPVGVTAREVAVVIDRSTTIQLPLVASHVAVHWNGNPRANVSVALSQDGTTFGAPIGIQAVDKHDNHQTETFSGVLWTGGARAVRIDSDVSLGHATVV